MKIEHINPFINATIHTFKTMCQVTPVREGKLELNDDRLLKVEDMIGVIGLSGRLRGAILMSMETPIALKVISAFLMEEITEPTPDLMDGFGEILNIIAGAAAADLKGYDVKLAIPTVVTGKDQQVLSKTLSPWVIIPMKFPEWGPFKIQVNMIEE